jgi:hypothetical protein
MFEFENEQRATINETRGKITAFLQIGHLVRLATFGDINPEFSATVSGAS